MSIQEILDLHKQYEADVKRYAKLMESGSKKEQRLAYKQVTALGALLRTECARHLAAA